MKALVSALVALAFMASISGCATIRNTKVPKAFKDVGICGYCGAPIALDGLADDESAICPECGARIVVGDTRLGFKRDMAARRNARTARSFLTVTWLAAAVAGAVYGIPIPPPPIDEDTFKPYRAPFSIKCRRARRVPAPAPYDSAVLTGARGNLYVDRRLPNPYEIDGGPYSVVINDYYDNGEGPDAVKDAKLRNGRLSFQEDMLYSLYQSGQRWYDDRESAARKTPP